MADIERLATELVALTPAERSQVQQRVRELGTSWRDLRTRLETRRTGERGWALYIGEDLYDTFGVAVCTLRVVKLKSENIVELEVVSKAEGSETWQEKQQRS